VLLDHAGWIGATVIEEGRLTIEVTTQL